MDLRPSRLACVVTILVAGVVAYSNSFHVPYLFDDRLAIELNSTQRSSKLSTILSPPRDTTLTDRPIANASFALNRAVTRESMVGLHAGNLIIHLLTALILFGLTWRTFLLPPLRDRYGEAAVSIAAVVTILWVVHPVQTESVTYLVQRAESQSGMFVLLALYCSMRAGLSASPIGWFLAATAACLLGDATKETAIVAPVLVGLYDRAFLFSTLREQFRKRCLFYAALAGTWLFVAHAILSEGHPKSAGLHFARFGPFDYLQLQGGAILRYLRLIVWPHPLIFDYGEPNEGVRLPVSFLDWGPQAILVALLGLASVAAWRWWPSVAFLGCSFFVLLAPSSSVMPIATEVISEHRIYIASVPVLLLVVLGVRRLLTALSVEKRWLSAGLAAGAAALLIVLTLHRNHQYESPMLLWEANIRDWPGNPRAFMTYAAELEESGDLAAAQRAVDRGLAVSPRHAGLNGAAGRLAQIHGDCRKAMGHFDIALAWRPMEADLQARAGVCLARLGRLDESVGHFRKALEYAPDDAAYLSAYGGVLGRLGRFDEAIETLQNAVRVRPNWAEPYFNLGGVYARMNRKPDAIAALRKALEIDPALQEARDRLATLKPE